jgi:hypothetical protein
VPLHVMLVPLDALSQTIYSYPERLCCQFKRNIIPCFGNTSSSFQKYCDHQPRRGIAWPMPIVAGLLKRTPILNAETVCPTSRSHNCIAKIAGFVRPILLIHAVFVSSNPARSATSGRTRLAKVAQSAIIVAQPFDHRDPFSISRS